MAESLLIFSVGPVQGFIAEARRAQDLYAGSALLSEVAEAALQACLTEGATRIYPAEPENPERPQERRHAVMPNRFVVRVNTVAVSGIAEAAARAAQQALDFAAGVAQRQLASMGPVDDVWHSIWRRQLQRHLEFYWAAAPLDGPGYQAAYHLAERAFEAAKRTRAFDPAREDGLKDSLSGARSALRTADGDAQDYWKAVKADPPLLKPEGRERLDALGATKRFGFQAQHFPSLSTVAAGTFLLLAARRCPALLRDHRLAVAKLKPFRAGPVADKLPALGAVEWPYDGDLLYLETFTPERLKEDYGLTLSPADLKPARETLSALIKAVGMEPSRYYAILQMDGNRMGKHIWHCTSEHEHAELSRRLARFAAGAMEMVERGGAGGGDELPYAGRVIYAGGDDLLALLPLWSAVPAACALARSFRDGFEGLAQPKLPFSLRGGLAIAHHRYPLSATLAEAHRAEGAAKQVADQAGLAVRVLLRSGSPVEALAPLGGLQERFEEVRGLFATRRISPRLAHNLAEVAATLESLPREAFAAELHRVAQRQRNPRALSADEARAFADSFAAWQAARNIGAQQGAAWLLVASFVARGGEVE